MTAAKTSMYLQGSMVHAAMAGRMQRTTDGAAKRPPSSNPSMRTFEGGTRRDAAAASASERRHADRVSVVAREVTNVGANVNLHAAI